MKAFFLPVITASGITMICLKFLTSPNCFCGKSSLRKRMSVETWWNDTEREKKELPGVKPVSVPLCPHKYHVDGPRIDFLFVR